MHNVDSFMLYPYKTLILIHWYRKIKVIHDTYEISKTLCSNNMTWCEI